MLVRSLPALMLTGTLVACQTSSPEPTPFSTPSQERPAGVAQSAVSDGDIDGDDGI